MTKLKKTPTRDSALRRDLGSKKYRQRVKPGKLNMDLEKWKKMLLEMPDEGEVGAGFELPPTEEGRKFLEQFLEKK